MRVSGPRPLDPDSYDRIACAVCMKIATPVLLGPGAAAAAGATASTAAAPPAATKTEGGGGEAAGGGEAGGAAAAAAVEEDLVQCAKCGVRVHRKCYGVPEGVGAPGAGGRMIGNVFGVLSLSLVLSLCTSWLSFVRSLFVSWDRRMR